MVATVTLLLLPELALSGSTSELTFAYEAQLLRFLADGELIAIASRYSGGDDCLTSFVGCQI